MTGTLIATTSKAAMHALAYQGIMVADCFPQIRDMLRRKFGDEYVLLFAEPAPNATAGSIDWYSPVQGEVRRVMDLPPEQQERLRAKLRHMGDEIRRFAEELKQSPDALKLTRGGILELALCYPGEDALYAVGGQPLFICWGFGPGTPGAEPQSLCRLAAGAPARPAEGEPVSEPSVPPAPSAPPARRGVSAWWLLPLLLLLLLLFLLFTAFGPLPALSGRSLWHLPAVPLFQPDPAIAQAEGRAAALEGTLEALRDSARRHAAACVPAKPVPQPAKPKEAPKPEEPRPEAPRPEASKPEEPRPEAPRPEEPKQDLHIPEEASDMGFLRGRWRCDTGLENTRTHEPVVFEFFFDDSGKGEGVVHERNDVCVGEARAALRDGMLHIDLGQQKCRRTKTHYNRLSIECQNSAGRVTICKGTNEDGSTWDASFNRTR